MLEYGIGGTEVQGGASEAIADIPQNRTLLCEKLTADAPVKPKIVEGLQTIEDVFHHFKPEVTVDFEDRDGAKKEETLEFRGLSDFGIRGITAQSDFLRMLNLEKEQYQKMIKQLKSNRLLRKTLENPQSKADLLTVIYALIRELEEAHS